MIKNDKTNTNEIVHNNISIKIRDNKRNQNKENEILLQTNSQLELELDGYPPKNKKSPHHRSLRPRRCLFSEAFAGEGLHGLWHFPGS
jgi:hypothetical protein